MVSEGSSHLFQGAFAHTARLFGGDLNFQQGLGLQDPLRGGSGGHTGRAVRAQGPGCSSRVCHVTAPPEVVLRGCPGHLALSQP